MLSLPSLLAARVAGMSLTAKVGAGAMVAVASVTTAGATGTLPAPVQNAVADAVHATTPFTFPRAPGGGAVPAATAPSDVRPTATPTPSASAWDNSSKGLSVAGDTPASPHVPTAVPPSGYPTGKPGLPTGNPGYPTSQPSSPPAQQPAHPSTQPGAPSGNGSGQPAAQPAGSGSGGGR